MGGSTTPENIQIAGLDQFGFFLSQWHQKQVSQLKQLEQIPDGFAVSVDDEPEVALTGDLRKGFLMGITVALSLFQNLPFMVQTEEPEAANEPQVH